VLKFGLAKVVHGNVVRDTEWVKGNIITNVSAEVLRVREEGKSGALFGIESRGGLASYRGGSRRGRMSKKAKGSKALVARLEDSWVQRLLSLQFSFRLVNNNRLRSSHVPPWEAGAKAAAAPKSEARITNFMVLF
jgi:hypothetical protein